jgi:hypothetical protein
MRHGRGLTAGPYPPGTLLAVRKVAGVTGVRGGLDTLLIGEPEPRPPPIAPGTASCAEHGTPRNLGW